MLKAKHDPTFWAEVPIPTPSGKDEVVKVEFVHKSKDELDEFLKSQTYRGKSDVENVMAIARAWDGVDVPFGPEGLAQVFQDYQGAPGAIVKKYIAALNGERLGN